MNFLSIQDLPDLRSAFQVFLSFILLYVVTWVIYSRYFHPLSGIPGPFWASLSRLWLAKQASDGRIDEVLRNLHGELGNSYGQLHSTKKADQKVTRYHCQNCTQRGGCF